MRQRLALVAIEQNNVAGFGLLLAQLQTQADPFDLVGDLASLQGVPRSPPTELFFRSALDSCDRLMRTPARASTSARSRGICPIAPIGHGRFQQGRDPAQSRFAFRRDRAGRHAGLQRRNVPAHEVAAPQANRIFAHAKRLRDLGARPTSQRQKHRSRPVRLAAISRTGKRQEAGALFIAHRNRRLSRHAIHLANRCRQPTAKSLSVG
jgi:hypothetical protein